MVLDAWLPVGFALPNGTRMKRVLAEGPQWQIVESEEGGRALIVADPLVRSWIDARLIEPDRFGHFDFGGQSIHAIAFPPGAILAPVNNCSSPSNKTDALAFATALKSSRDIDPVSPLQDALYVEALSRLLPTHTISSRVEDAVILGYWLTGGVRAVQR